MSLDLLKKADMVLQDLTDNGGVLVPEQGNKFVEELIDQPTILKKARTITMDRPQMEINALGFGSRLLHAATENTAPTDAQRSKPTTRRVTLNTKEFIAEVNLPYAVLEDNIERGTLEQTLLRLLAQYLSRDIEELILRGDTTIDPAVDDYLYKLNGFPKRITHNVVDATSTGITETTFNNALLALADKYKRDLTSLRFFVPTPAEQAFRLRLAGRQTVGGDAWLTGAAPISCLGVGIEKATFLPTGVGMLVDPFNLIVGIQRQVTIESWRDVRARQMVYVCTIRMDINIETELACVKLTGLV